MALHVDHLDGVFPLGQLLAVLLPQHTHHLNFFGQSGLLIDLKLHDHAQQAAYDGVQALRNDSALRPDGAAFDQPGDAHAGQYHDRAEQGKAPAVFNSFKIKVKGIELFGNHKIDNQAEGQIGEQRSHEIQEGIRRQICGRIKFQGNKLQNLINQVLCGAAGAGTAQRLFPAGLKAKMEERHQHAEFNEIVNEDKQAGDGQQLSHQADSCGAQTYGENKSQQEMLLPRKIDKEQEKAHQVFNIYQEKFVHRFKYHLPCIPHRPAGISACTTGRCGDFPPPPARRRPPHCAHTAC